MTASLLLLAAAGAAAPAAPSPSPTPTTPVTILLAKPEGAPPPQGGSLAEVASRIKLKLPANQPRVLTNDSVKRLAEGVELTTSAPVGGGTGAAAGPRLGGSQDSKKVMWQQRYRTAVQRVKTLEAEVKTLEARTAGLERDFYAESDPARRDAVIKPNWDNTLGKLQATRTELEEAKKQPDEVVNAARRDGALPGWFRGIDEEPVTPPQGVPAPRSAPTPTPSSVQPHSLQPVGPS